jgi:hypothetical protein
MRKRQLKTDPTGGSSLPKADARLAIRKLCGASRWCDTSKPVVPVIHMMGKGVGVGSNIAGSSGAFFFVWTLLALGVSALFSVILSVRGLWNPEWGQSL